MNVSAFLRRIDYAGPTSCDEVTLRALHRAFSVAVPFENFDIHLGKHIVLDENAFFEKIVNSRRGGICYELNGLFAALLRELGFDVTLLSGRVFSDKGEMGRDFVHLLAMVRLDRRWIADVGFGDWAAEPLCLDSSGAQLVDNVRYQFTTDGQRYVAEQWGKAGNCWRPRYSFVLIPRRLSDFTAICDDLQTSPDSAFRRRRMCTRCRHDGQVTLTDDKLVITSEGKRTETALGDMEAYIRKLSEHFGIVFSLTQVQALRTLPPGNVMIHPPTPEAP